MKLFKMRCLYISMMLLIGYCLNMQAQEIDLFPYSDDVSYVELQIVDFGYGQNFETKEYGIVFGIAMRKGLRYGDYGPMSSCNIRYNLYLEPGVEVDIIDTTDKNNPKSKVTEYWTDETEFNPTICGMNDFAQQLLSSEHIIHPSAPEEYTAVSFGTTMVHNTQNGRRSIPDDFVVIVHYLIPLAEGSKIPEPGKTHIRIRCEADHQDYALDIYDRGSFWGAFNENASYGRQGFRPADWKEERNFWVGGPKEGSVARDGKYYWGDKENWLLERLPEENEVVTYRPINLGGASDLWVDADEPRIVAGIDNNGTEKDLIIDKGAALKITERDVNIVDADIIIKAETLDKPDPSDPDDPEGLKNVNGTFIVPKDYKVNAIVEFCTKGIGEDNATTVEEMEWQYFGIPVKTFAANKLQGAYVRRYDETRTEIKVDTIQTSEGQVINTLIYFWHWLDNSSIMSPVTGYEISRKNSSSPYYYFDGELNTSDIDTLLSHTPSSYFAAQHVVSNPYTAALDIHEGLEFGAALESTVYLFHTGSPDHWDIHAGPANTTNINAKGQYMSVPCKQAGALVDHVASMQGFVVKAKKDEENPSKEDMTLKFKYEEGVVLSNVKMRNQRATDNIYSRVNISSGEELKDRMWLFTDENSTRGFDNGYDGRKMVASSDLVQIYASEFDGNYQVNTVPNIHNTYLSFKAQKGVTTYTISFDHTNLEEKYHALFLTDLKTGVTKDVTEDKSSYSFTANNEEKAERRFLLSTIDKNEASGSDGGRISVYQHSGNIFISNNFDEKVDVSIYTASGILVRRFEMSPLSNASVLESAFTQGVYTIRMDVENHKEFSEKVIIK